MNGKTIIVIDDDYAVRGTIRIILERAGYHVIEAADGRAGIDRYRASHADLVITDLFMPGLDGIETIQLLRDEFPDARILAVSGGASVGAEGPLTDARLFGADATLAKPFRNDELLSRVLDLID